MSLEYFFPNSETHAIQSVIFVLEWQGDVTDHVLKQVERLAPQLKSNFPVYSVQKMVQLNVATGNEGAPIVSQNTDSIGGVSFQRAGKFGQVVSQLVVSRNNCMIVMNEYVRWAPVLEAVVRYFKIILPCILQEKSIGSIALQYNDLFTWKDAPENLNLREVFKSDSPYLAPNVFDQTDLWHCHHGFITDGLGSVSGKCLDNINVAIVDNQDDRAIQIITSHKFMLKNPLRLATKDYLQSIETVQNALHMQNKGVLRKLLTEEVCSKINL